MALRPSNAAAASEAVEQVPGAGEASVLSPELAALGLAFRRLFRAVSRMRGRDTHLVGGEISHSQFELLIELDERGELSAGELALAAGLSPASVTQMLDGLAESGRVERARSDSDRRVVLARLTPLGRAQVAAKRAAWRERWERALGDVSPRDLRAAAKVMERLGEVFERDPGAGPSGRPAEGAAGELPESRRQGPRAGA
jgi:DNA-binding MarR family transcriptional regulator